MTNVRRILIVDDDPELRDALVEQLALHEEFELVAVENGTKAVQAAKTDQIDLVIMDVGLPDVDGREAVRILRKGGFKAPIILLTGHDTDSDTILGLESGANDYVTKPFRFAVLLARIRAQLRQHEASEDAVFKIGPYTFRPSSKLLLNPKGNKVRLTEKETAILRYLYRAGQRRSRARRCCRRCGAIIPASPPTRSKPISTGCVRKSNGTPPPLRSLSPKAAATSWCRRNWSSGNGNRGRHHNFFERVPTLGLLGRAALRILAIGAESRYVHRGEVLFKAGESADCGFVVQEGSFRLSPRGADGTKSLTVGVGTLLGELAMFTETTRR